MILNFVSNYLKHLEDPFLFLKKTVVLKLIYFTALRRPLSLQRDEYHHLDHHECLFPDSNAVPLTY